MNHAREPYMTLRGHLKHYKPKYIVVYLVIEIEKKKRWNVNCAFCRERALVEQNSVNYRITNCHCQPEGEYFSFQKQNTSLEHVAVCLQYHFSVSSCRSPILTCRCEGCYWYTSSNIVASFLWCSAWYQKKLTITVSLSNTLKSCPIVETENLNNRECIKTRTPLTYLRSRVNWTIHDVRSHCTLISLYRNRPFQELT